MPMFEACHTVGAAHLICEMFTTEKVLHRRALAALNTVTATIPVQYGLLRSTASAVATA